MNNFRRKLIEMGWLARDVDMDLVRQYRLLEKFDRIYASSQTYFDRDKIDWDFLKGGKN
ncbi:MAG: hypothetical protein UT24_C0011G0012 [Candidatus Woesebacteria bacterium GW2011_GWB1_39_12]|uniref:Uncharacterized protein n=1 Tax=Candidatus Woesebacteria bacterium GW2011_GWB1_39_12 TaxID=1618574 RepID=A0A0G0M8U6_9BACT|nr:MAG: hypothetical protein UT24_C0011G0012 [Candidatus Woesebacteria bacterium GW2011_GWB1_39_12]